LEVSYNPQILSEELTGAKSVYNFLMEVWDHALINLQEQVYAVYLNNKNQAIGWRCLNTGCTNKCDFDFKIALSIGLQCVAHKIIIAHNHPSGNVIPSVQDYALTSEFKKACDTVGIQLVDHLVISKKSFFSIGRGEVSI
jgi:DNA repair protein RadC